MPGPPTDYATDSGRSTVHRVVAAVRGDPSTVAAAVLAFLVGAVTTWYGLRVTAWDVLKRDLSAALGADIVAVTPMDVILLQAQVAATVGCLLAIETALYRVRDVLALDRWTGGPLGGWERGVVVLGSVASFPVGAVLGYDYAFPVVLGYLAAGDPGWTITRWAGLAWYLAIATGLVAQLAVVTGALALSRVESAA